MPAVAQPSGRRLRRTAAAVLLALAVPLTLIAVPPASASAARQADAYFAFTDITRQRFVIKLTDPVQIQHARDLIGGAATGRPHLIGRIVTRPAPYNPGWSHHLDPATIGFFDVAIEVCDATIPYVEDHLDEAGGAFLPGLVWCPWTSRLSEEVSPRAL
jgi:hypothetical protein